MVSFKKLKSELFLVPTAVIVISIAIVFIAFNLIVQSYIDNMTESAISMDFDTFGSDTESEDTYEEQEFIVPAYYIVLDEYYYLVYPKDTWISSREKDRTMGIYNYFMENIEQFKPNVSVKVILGENTYYVKSKLFEGSWEDIFMLTGEESDNLGTYTVLAYTNITPLQEFLNTINKTLVLLLIISAILSAAILYRMAKKIDSSFGSLKSYILSVGKREKANKPEEQPYEEFNQQINAVENMSDMIDRAEENQKIFFQNASHELRTPLMSIQGYAEGINTGIMNDVKSASGIIISESVKMSNLVDEILYLSKMDSEKDWNFERIDIESLIYALTDSLSSEASKKNISIIVEKNNLYMFRETMCDYPEQYRIYLQMHLDTQKAK